MTKKENYNLKTPEMLMAELADKKDKLLKLKFDLADKKLKDVSQIGKTKIEIARIMTALSKINKSK